MNKKLFAFFILSLGLNAFLVFKLYDGRNNTPAKEDSPRYKLINSFEQPAIDSNIQNESVILHYSGLKEQLEKEIENLENKEDIGIFLQDSRTGAWLGINEREKFIPASLLKIPIMMAVLKKVDREEMSLESKIQLTEEDLDQNSGELH